MNLMNLFRKKKNNHIAWKIAGGAALALAATALIRNYSDIKRYIKMSMM